MPRHGTYSWSTSVLAAPRDRAALPPVREERPRTIPGLPGRPALALSAWRGASGRRYVVLVYTLGQAEAVDGPGSVILGVRRGPDGRARIVGAGHRGTVAEAIALAAADGATEIHLHRLADTDAEREAVVEDLVGDDAL